MTTCSLLEEFLDTFYEALDCLPLAALEAIFEFYFLSAVFFVVLGKVELTFWFSTWAKGTGGSPVAVTELAA